jgi:hypothetical protein
MYLSIYVWHACIHAHNMYTRAHTHMYTRAHTHAQVHVCVRVAYKLYVAPAHLHFPILVPLSRNALSSIMNTSAPKHTRKYTHAQVQHRSISSSMSSRWRKAGGNGARGLPISDMLRNDVMVARLAGSIVRRLLARETAMATQESVEQRRRAGRGHCQLIASSSMRCTRSVAQLAREHAAEAIFRMSR